MWREINKNIQMDHLIAQNDNDYIAKAISLENDNNLSEKYGINLEKGLWHHPYLIQINLRKI